jgi:hypothetical protein
MEGTISQPGALRCQMHCDGPCLLQGNEPNNAVQRMQQSCILTAGCFRQASKAGNVSNAAQSRSRHADLRDRSTSRSGGIALLERASELVQKSVSLTTGRFVLAKTEPPREPRPPKTAPRLRDGSVMLFTPALIRLPVHASWLVWKFEARPIATQPRPDLPRLHLTAIALRLQLGLIGQIAAFPTRPALATEVEESHPANTARAEEPWPAPPEFRPRPTEIHGLLDRSGPADSPA